MEVKRPRSAEQTARLLLSNAFRYDTWECTAARHAVQKLAGTPLTVRLAFHPVERQELPEVPGDERVEALNLSIFDVERKAFLGAAYRSGRRCWNETLVFQAAPKQLLVVELLVRDTRSTAPLEEMRVSHWASLAVDSLGRTSTFNLRPGNAHLLLLDEELWPAVSRPSAPSMGGLTFRSRTSEDEALVQLMGELVPPGVFVSDAFTKAVPKEGAGTFRLCISGIELSGTSSESSGGLADPDSDWAVAVVAHNGYQQLGKGAEVPLVLQGGAGSDTSASSSSLTGTATSSSSYGYSYSASTSRDSATTHSSSSSGKQDTGSRRDSGEEGQAKGKSTGVVLRSELPLEMESLPVHSATSLVLAIRRRTPATRTFKVVGFCVFPLCIMPMQNRDIRVENLPALRGPFSCEDARMLMVDSSSPYGRVPIAMTLTVEYHDVANAAQSSAASAVPAGDAGPLPAGQTLSAPLSSAADTMSERPSPLTQPSASMPGSAMLPWGSASASAAGPAVGPPDAGAVVSPAAATGGSTTAATAEPSAPAPAGVPGGAASDGIFKLLCSIMEELQKVREAQDAILRQTSDGRLARDQMSLEKMQRLGQQLADGPLELVDLTPRPQAVSWAARRAITDNVQPIYHPLKGTILDDNAVAPPGSLRASLFGMRFEGVTLDCALTMPDDLCVMFSFGPLPYQQVGPMHAVSVQRDEDGINESFKLYDSDDRGGLVWSEPPTSIASPAMAKYKENGGNSTVYVHLYDALTMFYVATASVPLAHFHRPYNMEAAVVPMDLVLQRDYSLTEHLLPPEIFPIMRYAGQLHVSLFCVGVSAADSGAGSAGVKSHVLKDITNGPHVIVARRLPHTDLLMAPASASGPTSPVPAPPPGAPPSPAPAPTTTAGAADGSVDSPKDGNKSLLLPLNASASGSPLHWLRADYVKKMLSSNSAGSPQLPGVPDAHVRAAQLENEMEYKLRFVEKQRSEAKAATIARVLLGRMTVQHKLHVTAWRPETVKSSFQNPHRVPMQFFVDVPAGDQDVCRVVNGANSFFLGPKEQTEVQLVVCLCPDEASQASNASPRSVKVKIVSEKGEVMRYVEIQAVPTPPLVDRRYEVFGPAGSTATKKIFSRLFSSSSFPVTASQAELLKRMEDLCSYAATSSTSGQTTVRTNAVLDPITQTYVTAWEEATVETVIPTEAGQQRLEYVTLFYDADRTRVYETWELCIFACECLTTREISWGQTTALGLPAAGSEELYCSDPGVQVEQAGPSYVLRLRPKEAIMQRLLLHTLLADGNLKKTIMTVPVSLPTPSFAQVIELSLEEVANGPVLRRLTVKNRDTAEEVYQVHHNYRYQLKVSPMKFALAPGDTQFLSLQLDSLTLPPGQLEGRWPMWIFVNNEQDKTVESYYLQVVVRAHPVLTMAPQ